MKLLVVGCGRSGTGWCAEVLNRAGVRCGHQSVFKHENALGWEPVVWDDWEADSSYEAVPLLPTLTDVRSVLVVRNPLDNIRSWLEHGAFGDDMALRFRDFTRVLQRFFPQVLEYDTPVDRAAAYWLMWNRYAEPWVYDVLYLGGLPPARLLEALDVTVPESFRMPPIDKAADDKVADIGPVDWFDIMEPLRWVVARQVAAWMR